MNFFLNFTVLALMIAVTIALTTLQAYDYFREAKDEPSAQLWEVTLIRSFVNMVPATVLLFTLQTKDYIESFNRHTSAYSIFQYPSEKRDKTPCGRDMLVSQSTRQLLDDSVIFNQIAGHVSTSDASLSADLEIRSSQKASVFKHN